MTMRNISESSPSVQEEIFNTLLRSPHSNVDEILQIHAKQLERDPFLYGCLAVYAVHNGECSVRDIQNVFVATLFASKFSAHRELAWVMLQDLPAYRVERILNYITGYTEVVKHTSLDKPMPASGSFGMTYERAKYSKKHHDKSKRGTKIERQEQKINKKLRALLKTNASKITVDTYKVRHNCLGKTLNRNVISAVKNYLRFRELDVNKGMMEGSILRMKNSVKSLYAKCHILPGNDETHWVNRVLFHNEVPENSRLSALKRVINSDDPAEQAEIILDAGLPYPVACTIVKTMTPSILVALINSMSSQELLANLASIKRQGAFDNEKVKELIKLKLVEAKKSKRGKVDAMKGNIASKTTEGLDTDTQKLVHEVTDAQLKLHGQISRSTALIIDKSYSMTKAIEAGKRIGAAIGQAGKDMLKACYVFSNTAVSIPLRGDIGNFSTWEKMLSMHRADGCTNMGSCLSAMMRSGISVEQIIILTDEGDNGTPKFSALLKKYEEKFGHMPDITIIRWGNCELVTKGCKHKGAVVNVLPVDSVDNISLPNVIRLLSGKSTFDLIQEIIELPHPTKKEWFERHPEMQTVLAV